MDLNKLGGGSYTIEGGLKFCVVEVRSATPDHRHGCQPPPPLRAGGAEISRAGGLSIINPRLYWDVVSFVVVVR